MTMQPPVLITGDIQHREFAGAVAWLEANCSLTRAEDFDAAISAVQNERPLLVVVAQSRPGQYSAAAIERIYAAAPLARLVALLGSWCEGETRTGQPWPGVIRLYWHQWETRAPAEIARLLEPRTPNAWKLPRTATPVERLLAAPPDPPSLTLRAGIYADEAVVYDALAGAVEAAGCTPVRLATPGKAHHNDAGVAGSDNASSDVAIDGKVHADCDLLLFDAADWRQRTQQRLAAVTSEQRPCVVLMNFPRKHEVDEAVAAGASAVVSKPYLVDDLWRAMQRVAH